MECYGLRDGSAGRAELVHGLGQEDVPARRRAREIDQLYRDWARNRADLHRLERLHAAISEALEENTAGVL